MARRTRTNVPIYLEIEEINAMLARARNLRDYTMVYLAYKTGLRCHELTSLRIEHIDTRNRLLTVVNGKGEKDRQVYLDEDTIQKIRFYLGDRKEGIAFLSGKPAGKRGVKRTVYLYDDDGERVSSRTKIISLDEGQMNDATVERIVRNMARDAGVRKAKPVTTHTLRHTFACQALLGGVPITTVQMALGHASLRTTEVYLRAIQTQKQMKLDFGAHPIPAADRPTEQRGAGFSCCPYCGRDLDLPKQPVFCPYCRERLSE